MQTSLHFQNHNHTTTKHSEIKTCFRFLLPPLTWLKLKVRSQSPARDTEKRRPCHMRLISFQRQGPSETSASQRAGVFPAPPPAGEAPYSPPRPPLTLHLVPLTASPSTATRPLFPSLCSTAQVPKDFPAVFFSCLLEYLTQISRPSLDISPEQMHGLDLPPPLGLFLLGPLQMPLVLPERRSLDLRRGGRPHPGLPQVLPQICFPASRSPWARAVSAFSSDPSAQRSGNTAKRTNK